MMLSLSWRWSLFVLLTTHVVCIARNIFVVGGSGFMGKLFIERAVSLNHTVWMLNRGRSAPSFMHNHPLVFHVPADRFDSQQFRRAVRKAALEVPGGRWDAVVDFTAFQHTDAVNAVAAFFSRTKHYVFISTISAYQIVTPADNTFHREVQESDMLPPPGPQGVNTATYEQRIKSHRYGAGKYLIEHKLLEAWHRIGFPFTSIRLPEVVGPGADDRHWFYQLWLETNKPVQLHPATNGITFRCVYRDDAVRAIEAVIDLGRATFGESYNIAHEELIDMKEYIHTVADVMGKPRPTILFSPGAPFNSLPSALFGPLSIEKAAKALKWKPTPFREFMATTVAWWRKGFNTKTKSLPAKIPQDVKDVLMTIRI